MSKNVKMMQTMVQSGSKHPIGPNIPSNRCLVVAS